METEIFKEIERGSFHNFNNLPYDRKVEIMKTWDQNIWIRFRMQDTITEEEVFEPINKLIENDGK